MMFASCTVPSVDAGGHTDTNPSIKMSDPRHDRDASLRRPETSETEVRYPENRVLAIVDTQDQLDSVLQALRTSGFIDSEIDVMCGQAAAAAVKASTGRSGLTDVVIRVARRLGLQDEETETKDRYEEALRSDQYVVSVAAPTDERKELAAQLLATRGAHFINFLGHFSIHQLKA